MGGGHGHDDAHGHGGPEAAHGHGEIPPAPDTRWISPARAAYEQPWPGNLLLWPFVWIGVALLLFVAARTWSHDWAHEPAAGHEGAPEGGHPGAAPAGRPHGE